MKVAIVANRLKDMTAVHPEQDNDHVCSQCGKPVGMYPSSLMRLRENPQAIIVCTPCALKKMKPGDLHATAGTWDDIIRESHESVRRQ